MASVLLRIGHVLEQRYHDEDLGNRGIFVDFPEVFRCHLGRSSHACIFIPPSLQQAGY
jgi:hypothetical protein